MKSLVSKKGYGIYLDSISKKDLEALEKQLTVKPVVMSDYDFGSDTSFPVYRLSSTRIYIPRFYGIKKYGPAKVKIKNGVDANLKFNGSLMNHQVEFCNKILEELDKNESCIANSATGSGKTAMALWIASQLGKRTIILVHKEFLMNQWIERINQFLPESSIGIIRQNTCEPDKDIVIAMVQSINSRDYPDGTFDSHHLVIIDECMVYNQLIATENGPMPIGILYEMWKNKDLDLPNVLSYNESLGIFELKKITYAWEKNNKNIIKIIYSSNDLEGSIECTDGHKILTGRGYIVASELQICDEIMCFPSSIAIAIKSITRTMNQDPNNRVYDLEVENNHNFILSINKYNTHGPIVHNCHHMAAQGFSQSFFKIGSRKTLALSATPKRSDGLTKVLDWFLGATIVNETVSKIGIPSVKFIRAEYSTNIVPKFNFKGVLNAPNVINQLVIDPARNQQIIEETIALYKTGRKILILSGRRNHCQYLSEQLDLLGLETGLYLGQMKNEDLIKSNKARVVLATYTMASEAYDNPELDTLIMATGMGNVQQSIGRILRKTNKHEPLVIDFTDIEFFGSQAKRRKAFYKKSKYNYIIDNLNLDESDKNEDDEDQLDTEACMF